jgi:hypothetical protein
MYHLDADGPRRAHRVGDAAELAHPEGGLVRQPVVADLAFVDQRLERRHRLLPTRLTAP